MNQLKGACIIGQSGGPTSVINASAYGAIKTALKSDCITKTLGALNGIRGILDDNLIDLGKEDPKELELLKYTPSSALGSCRYKLSSPEVDDTDYKRILEIFKKYDVRYFFYNGGNDSMDTCNKVSKYLMKNNYECRVMGIPKTIDNDLVEDFKNEIINNIKLNKNDKNKNNDVNGEKYNIHKDFIRRVEKFQTIN